MISNQVLKICLLNDHVQKFKLNNAIKLPRSKGPELFACVLLLEVSCHNYFKNSNIMT